MNLMLIIIQVHYQFGETNLIKNGIKSKIRDLTQHLKECGNFTYVIVRLVLNQRI